MNPLVDNFIPIALGISLAAATGFRVFIPLLVMGLSVKAGLLPVSENFAWLAATPALLMLGIAAVTEAAAYYVPVLDNVLDGIAGPIAVGAGIMMTGALLGDMQPMLKWSLAIIAGGGAAAATQSVTTLLRGSSTVLTGGFGNSAIATGEIAGALALSVIAILLPMVAVVLVLLFCVVAWRMMLKTRRTHDNAL